MPLRRHVSPFLQTFFSYYQIGPPIRNSEEPQLFLAAGNHERCSRRVELRRKSFYIPNLIEALVTKTSGWGPRVTAMSTI
jgi:hypothetical protein